MALVSIVSAPFWKSQIPKPLGLNLIKRMASSDCKKSKSDGCCGVRQDCALMPCKAEDSDCYYATHYRYPCPPFYYVPLPCDYNPCELYPLLDWLYYRPSDKAKRQYQKTWIDCPPTTKLKCKHYDIPEFPPIKRRSKVDRESGCRPPTACETNSNKFMAICKPPTDTKSKCPYLEAPCCLVGRRPPSCKKLRKESDCVKPCCPYPAFSECCISGIAYIPSRNPHCTCLAPVYWCQAVRELIRSGNAPLKRYRK